MNWKIVFVLLAVSLLLAGCAKGGQRGGTNETGAGTGSGGTGTGGTTGETGTQTGGTSGGSGTGGTSGGATTSGDVGNLFQIDTDQPLEGSGYNVPAAGEE